VKKEIESQGFFVETNFSDEKIEKKIRNSQLEQFNFILVIGKKEKESNMVNVRTRDNVVHGMKKLDDLIKELKQKQSNYE
jgi:threonyl-tRNA synthetase